MLPSKKVLSIFILVAALVVAIIITFGRDKASSAISYTSNLVAGEKVKIPENPNWQNELSGAIPPASDTGVNTDSASSTETTTDTVSRTLISNYLALEQSGTLDDTSAQKLVNQTLDYINQGGSQVVPTIKVNIVADNGRLSVADYGENLGNILRNNKSKDTSNELETFQAALDAKDQKKLEELQGAIDTYEKLLNDIAKMPVPKTFVKAHTDMMIGMGTIISGLQDMKKVFNDPVKGLQGMQTYQDGGNLFLQAIQATLDFIKQNNIIYKQGSGGYYLLNGI